MVADCGETDDTSLGSRHLQPSGGFNPPVLNISTRPIMMTTPIQTVVMSPNANMLGQPISQAFSINEPATCIYKQETQVVSEMSEKKVLNPFANQTNDNLYGMPQVDTGSVHYISNMLGVQKQDLNTKAEGMLNSMRQNLPSEYRARYEQLSRALGACINDDQRAYVIKEIERLENSMKGVPISGLMVESVVSAGGMLFGQELPSGIKQELNGIITPYISQMISSVPSSTIAPIIMTGVEVGLMSLCAKIKESTQSLIPPKMQKVHLLAKKL